MTFTSLANTFGPTARRHLPASAALWTLLATGCSPTIHVSDFPSTYPADATIRLEALEDRTQSWRIPPKVAELRGLRLLYDTPPGGGPTLAVVHAAVRANHRLAPFDALVFATHAVRLARKHRMAPGFFCATLLQESAFSPDAMSPAGAIGIAQFTLDTADGAGIDPFDWADAMRGSAALLGGYVRAYDGLYPDPYGAALAAYNAGPAAVEHYRGVPPYAETRDYIGDVYDRWSRIDRDAAAPAPRRRPKGGARGSYKSSRR